MLTKIYIKNFALIDELEVDFSNGFSMDFSGAGKSILLNALSIVTGKRVGHKILKNDSIKCVVEVEFNLTKLNIKNIFDLNNIDYFDQTILRREILPGGKSRSFINDTPANLAVQVLVTIIKQSSSSLVISNDNFFFLLIDNLSKQQSIVKNFSEFVDII